MEYGVSDDYLDEEDDGIMYSTRYYCSDSDEDSISSFPLSSSKKCKKQSTKRVSFSESASSDEDDFEKQMKAELSKTMQKLTGPMASTSSKPSADDDTKPEYYDSIYFDSDDSDKEEEKPKQKLPPNEKHKVLTNDELFYDPLQDDADQAWVDKNRRSYQYRKNKIPGDKRTSKLKPLPQSDAVLNCPACFTTLCLDCQRHEIYKNQYRAMFVFNCEVDCTEVLHFALKEDKKGKKGKNKKRQKTKTIPPNETVDCAQGESNLNDANLMLEGGNNAVMEASSCNGDGDDAFNPVKCTVCNTKVAVIDKDELYHFFNVITSY